MELRSAVEKSEQEGIAASIPDGDGGTEASRAGVAADSEHESLDPPTQQCRDEELSPDDDGFHERLWQSRLDIRQAAVGDDRTCRAAAARASIQFFQAIRQPSRMNAPGGRIASRKPG